VPLLSSARLKQDVQSRLTGWFTLRPELTLSFKKALKSGQAVKFGVDRRGLIRNDLGCAFSPVDGYGLVNAQEAVVGR
jgi:hypothetical protein